MQTRHHLRSSVCCRCSQRRTSGWRPAPCSDPSERCARLGPPPATPARSARAVATRSTTGLTAWRQLAGSRAPAWAAAARGRRPWQPAAVRCRRPRGQPQNNLPVARGAGRIGCRPSAHAGPLQLRRLSSNTRAILRRKCQADDARGALWRAPNVPVAGRGEAVLRGAAFARVYSCHAWTAACGVSACSTWRQVRSACQLGA